MKTMNKLTIATIAVVLVAASGIAWSAQDKYSLKLPNGLAFSEFRGYENWQVVSVSQTADLLKVEVANPTMIDAYRAGIPGNGKPFPDGSKIAKIEWKPKKMAESPFSVNVPDTLQDVFLIEKDSKRFPDTKGWAYAVFDYQPASDTFTAGSDRHGQLRFRVPHDREGQGLHFSLVPEAMIRHVASGTSSVSTPIMSRSCAHLGTIGLSLQTGSCRHDYGFGSRPHDCIVHCDETGPLCGADPVTRQLRSSTS